MRRTEIPAYDPNLVRPATREETLPVGIGAVAVGFIALVVCVLHGYLLLYGDAVSHLGIARRIVDSRNAGLGQLGGVWLPLPHLLMTPFVGKMEWWQNGMAGAWPSLLFYVLGVMGFYRLTRRMMTPRWAFAATLFYGLNPNLLYLSTTAMTEPLFLALLIWMVLLTMECIAAIDAGQQRLVRRRLVWIGLLIFCAVMTRYDGWILGAAVWCILAYKLFKRPALRVKVTSTFAILTVLAIAGPLLWFWYNQHFEHDWLDFMRGPYSAVAIDKRTTPPGAQHYRGWHNIGWATIFYTRTAQVDAAAWETGFLLMAAALTGLWSTLRKRLELASTLLWLPLPFYIYSVAYGSVPIFIPQLYPHSFYNSRYGMELLPALAVFAFVAVEWLQSKLTEPRPLIARLMPQIALALIVLNSVAMMYRVPLVLQEGKQNSITRVAFESSIAKQLDGLTPGMPILIQNSNHIGALQTAGIPLKQTVGESDWDSWSRALSAPAEHAAFVVSIGDDEVAKAVAAHPEGLTELTVLCTSGQGCARFYRSDKFGAAVARP
ncbi:hypothetical protein FTO74_01465 [Granulicella sp. WH15]|nr:hypothetical protein FTO74_01465 [Granulicella sp. WH15]